MTPAPSGPPLPPDEDERLAALRALGVLDTPPDPLFDGFVKLAATICGAPIGLISLIDRDRQWFKARVGLETPGGSRETAFCSHTILDRHHPLVVPDATADPRFARNPSVLADPHVRFYAGQPLVTPSGHAVGALCVVDRVPRELRPDQLAALKLLAEQVVAALELQRQARRDARLAAWAASERPAAAPTGAFERPGAGRERAREVPGGRARWIAAAVAAAGVALTLAGFAASRAAVSAARQARFVAEAEAVRDAVEERLIAYEETLAGARAFAVARGRPSRGEWRAFAESLALSTRPGIVRLGFASWVDAGGLETFQRALRRERPGFAVHPPGERPRYLPIVHFEPDADDPERALGFDLLTSPGRRRAIERARESDKAAMTERVELLQGGHGVVMFMPTRPEAGPEGVVYASLRIEDLIRGVAPGTAGRMQVRLFDGPAAAGNILFDGSPETAIRGDALRAELSFERAGRPLTLQALSRPGFDRGATSREPWLVLIAGLLVSALAAGTAWSAASTWTRARALAARLARDATRNEERVRTVVDNVAEGILTFDEGGGVGWCNAAAEQLFGAPAAALAGRSIEELVPVARGDLRDGFRNEAFGRRADGALFPVELSVSQMRAEDQPLFVAVVRDATERREVERMKDEFVSTVSHELRTPLTSIRGSLGLLRSGVLGELPADAREAVAIAERNSERLLALINDILDVERLRAGEFELAREPVAASALVAAALDSIRPVADARGVRIETSVREAEVDGDRRRLGQVLVNLLSNAVKFSPEGGTVRLEAGPEGADVVFHVIDRGRGVPPEHQAAIFERFRQVEASDSRERGGSGLGLAICKALVERHGGRIGVDSVPGAGSTFWFRVPRAAEEQP